MAKSKKKAAKANPEVTHEQVIEAFQTERGNMSRAAKSVGLPRNTFRDHLTRAEKALGVNARSKFMDGRLHEADNGVMPLPPPGQVARYILTSIQNNTHLHPGWFNLKAYADWLGQFGPSEFIVGTFSYQPANYGSKSVKRGSLRGDEGDALWYAPEAVEFIRDERVLLAPALMWCGEMNILPTATAPLSGLETYNGRKSNIFPHVKLAMESIPSMPDEGVKFNYTTGTITQRNYIQKKAGIKAEQGHSYGGLLVEVDSSGDWWVRQLHIDGNGSVYDVGPDVAMTERTTAVRIVDGEVRTDATVDSITWGDIHTAEMEPWVRDCGWRPGKGMVDALRPKRQIMHDIYSHRARSHHEMKDFHALYAKWANGEDSVEAEVQLCAEFLMHSWRPFAETIVVPSNHDRHLNRWLNDEDPRKDPRNARYHLTLQSGLLDSILNGDKTFNVLEFALRREGVGKGVTFLLDDQSYVICRDVDGGIECGLHGDRGPGGSRGTTRGLARLSRAINKGHDHTAAIRDNVYSVGACSLDFAYMKGPSAHSVSHVVTFENGRRQIITMWKGRWRA